MIPHCPVCNRIAFVKTYTIEQVNNGWIVRPFTASPQWAAVCHDRAEMWVYTSLDELLRGLLKLLTEDAVAIAAVPVPDPMPVCQRIVEQHREINTSP